MAAPLAVGGVHTGVVVCLGAVALGAWLIQGQVLAANKNARVVISIPSLAFWLLALVSLVQLVPLPPWLVKLASPTRWTHYQEGWAVLFSDRPLPNSWMPLSLDPEQTADRALRWLVLGLTALLVANHARLRHAWRDTLRMLTASGIAVLGVGAIQVLAGTEKVLFLYEPQASIKPYTTFVSPNHGAVFFGLTSICGFALALRNFENDIIEAIVATLAGVFLMVAMAEQDSSGARIGFGLGIVALIGFFLQSRQARRLFSKSRATALSAAFLSLPLVAPVVVFVSLRFGPDWVTDWLFSSEVGQWIDKEGSIRLELMSAALDGSLDYPAMGAGAGAIERVLSPYLDWSKLPMGVIPTIENEPVQWLLEFGWIVGPVTILLLASYLWFAFQAHTRGSRLRYGVILAAGLFLAFNSQFHFLFFTLGVAIPAMFLLEMGIARGSRPAEQHASQGHLSTGRTSIRFVVALCVIGAMSFGVWAKSHHGADLPQLSEAEAPEAQFERLNRLIPTEGELFAHAVRSVKSAEQVRQLADRAVALEPTAQMKLFKAQALWRIGDEEDSIATYQDVFSEAYPRVWSRWLREYLIPVVQDPAAIATALQNGDAGQWRVAAWAIREQLGGTAVTTFAMELLDQRPQEYEPHRLLIESYLRTRQSAVAELWARLLVSRALEGPDGEVPASYSLLVRALSQQGKREEARALILQQRERIEDDETLAILLIRLRTDDPRQAQEAEAKVISRFRSTYCSQPSSRTRQLWCWVAEGWLAEHEGELENARFAYERVQRKLDNPNFVGEFLARHGMCIELNELIARLKNSDGKVGRLERMTADCAASANEH